MYLPRQPLYKVKKAKLSNTKLDTLINLIRKYPKWYVVIFLVFGIILQRYFYDFNKTVFVGTEVRVVDGDTIVLDGLKIRLQGIDAPESKQTCIRKISREVWPCGTAATEKLTSLIVNQEIKCTDEGKDKYQRQLSYCHAGKINLNSTMVRQGYAVSYTRYDMSFILDELYAKWCKYGIWSSDFVRSSDWRKQYYRRKVN